jgi:hypothetical protein
VEVLRWLGYIAGSSSELVKTRIILRPCLFLLSPPKETGHLVFTGRGNHPRHRIVRPFTSVVGKVSLNPETLEGCECRAPKHQTNKEILQSIASVARQALTLQSNPKISISESPTFIGDPSHWYGLGLAFAIAAWVLVRALRRLCRFLAGVITYFCLRYLVYPILLSGFGYRLSWMDGIILVTFIGVNAFCIAFQTATVKDWSSRAGMVSMMNLVPLLTGTRFSLAADALGVSLRRQASLHKWLGLIATCEAVAHTVTSLPQPAWYGA